VESGGDLTPGKGTLRRGFQRRIKGRRLIHGAARQDGGERNT
jgi:hypothetical protein